VLEISLAVGAWTLGAFPWWPYATTTTHAGIRLHQYGNTSEPPFARARPRTRGRFNVHFQKTPGHPAAGYRPYHPNHPTIHQSINPSIHQSINPSIHPPPRPPGGPCGSHPSAPQTQDARPYPQYVKELARTHYLDPSPRLTPAIEAHILKKLIPPEGETRRFFK